MNAYYVLGTEDTAMNKTNLIAVLVGLRRDKHLTNNHKINVYVHILPDTMRVFLNTWFKFVKSKKTLFLEVTFILRTEG